MTRKTQAQPVAPLPTHEQMMRLACNMVERTLTCGIDAACGKNWNDALVSHVNAAELARMEIRRLHDSLPSGEAAFERYWFLVAGVVELVVEAFPNKDCIAWRNFKAAANQMSVLAEAVTWVSPESHN